MKPGISVDAAIRFSMVWEHGRLACLSTSSPLINHFLDLVKMSRSYNTWVSYAHDLKIFCTVLAKPLEAITRHDCITFMKEQDQAGYADATINRRLAAVSSLFQELNRLDPSRFADNPVHPRQHWRVVRQAGPSLYRRQPQRIPDILATDELRTFFAALPSWRDRTLVLLMWISCLRISEAVAICWQDIECSRRSLRIRNAKGGNVRTVFMDPFTFTALHRYLDEERQDLFPDVDSLFVAFTGRARGRPLTVNAVQKMLRYYAEHCGLNRLHAHLFRHTGITQLVQQGMAEPAVRQFVGHRSANSLLPYLHLCDEFVETEFAHAQAGLDPAHWLGLSPLGGKR